MISKQSGVLAQFSVPWHARNIRSIRILNANWQMGLPIERDSLVAEVRQRHSLRSGKVWKQL
jgi:hypothetical protein